MSGRMPDTESELSILKLATIVLRHRLAVLAMVLGGTLLVGVAVTISPRMWTTETSFFPQTSSDLSGSQLFSLAGRFGLDVGSVQPGQSAEFYAQLVRSREILGAIARDTFQVADTLGWFRRGRVEGAVGEIMDFDEDDAQLRWARSVEWLREEAVSVSVNTESGMTAVRIRTAWPELSGAIGRRIIELIHQFNLEVRQSQAAEERQFIEARLEAVESELRSAEDALQMFLQNNRAYANSPELIFQHDRLQRILAMRQQVYTSLMESLEQAKIAEVRNTPVITIVDRPSNPAKPDERHILVMILIGLIGGFGGGVLVALTMEYFAGARHDRDPELDREFFAVWKSAKNDFRRFLPRSMR